MCVSLCCRAEANHAFAEIVSIQHANEGGGCFFQSINDFLAIVDFPGLEPATHLSCKFRIQGSEILKNGEATHGDSLTQDLPHQVTQSIRTFGETHGVVLRDHAAHGHSRTGVELGENRVKDLAANTLEIDIDFLQELRRPILC